MLYKTRRMLRLFFAFAYYGFDREILPKFLCPSYLLIVLLPSCRKTIRDQSLGDRLYLACVHLGPIFVKLGQLLSVRSDIFDEALITPLERLQDQVPPFPSQQAILMIEEALKSPIDTLFETFDSKPIASASVAQVHQATLSNGDRVVVKVIRPHIARQIDTDIALLRWIIKQLGRLSRKVNPETLESLIVEYEYTIHRELDLNQEASNYTQMRHHFEHDKRLYVPSIYWTHTTTNVMTIEQVFGVPIDDMDTLIKKQVNRKRLAEHGVEIFFTQVFKHRFFHADMHPGNVFVETTDPEHPKYMAVDFGITGSLAPIDQYYLAENFLAFFNRDYTRIAQLHIESGWVNANTNLVHFESAIRTVCEPIFSQPIGQISFAALFLRIIQVGKQFDLHIQPQLLLLQKTLFNIEALGRKLYPELNLWETASPFLKEYMSQRSSMHTGWEHLKKELPRLLELSPKLPYMISNNLQPKKSHIIKPKASRLNLWLPTFTLITGMFIAHSGVLTYPGAVYILASLLIIITLWNLIKQQ